MSPESLMFGTINLDKYVSQPEQLTKAREKEVSELIGQLEGKVLNVEELPSNLLKIQRNNYPIIKPDFLSMGVVLEKDGKKVNVPRFSVYKKTGNGFADFSIDMCAYEVYERKNSFFYGIPTNVPTCRYQFWVEMTSDENLPEIFEKHLLKAVVPKDAEVIKRNPYSTGFTYHISRETFEKSPDRDKDHVFTTSFRGLIPKKTKEKIKEAQEIFGEEMYLIAETKPEAWRITKRIFKDPLLIGILENTCFLVDHFNTTPIEYFVAKEFTE